MIALTKKRTFLVVLVVTTLLSTFLPITTTVAAEVVENGDSDTAADDDEATKKKDLLTRKREAAVRMISGYISSEWHPSDQSPSPQVIADARVILRRSFPSESDIKSIIIEATKQSLAELRDLKGCTTEDIDKASETLATYADRHIHGMMNVARDPDCTTLEFDVDDPNYDSDEVDRVFEKCRIVVIRNVWTTSYMESYKKEFADFITRVNNGDILQEGGTTNGEERYIQEFDPGHHEIILPRKFATEEIIANDGLTDVLEEDGVLGEDFVLHSMSGILADSGAKMGKWRHDEEYLFGTHESFDTVGVGGHDLPPYAISVLSPFLNQTVGHGPIEFCLGTTHLMGLSDNPKVANEHLISDTSDYRTMRDYSSKNACPPGYWRSPQLNVGDVVMYDYQMEHRFGTNSSPLLVSMLHMVYSRSWFKDTLFRRDLDETKTIERKRIIEEKIEKGEWPTDELMEQLTLSSRFGLPDRVYPCDDDDEECIKEMKEFKLERIKNFIIGDDEVSKFQDEWEEAKREQATFLVTNTDATVANEDDTFLYLGGKSVGQLLPGKSVQVKSMPGTMLQLRSSTMVYKTWVIIPRQTQLVVASWMIEPLALDVWERDYGVALRKKIQEQYGHVKPKIPKKVVVEEEEEEEDDSGDDDDDNDDDDEDEDDEDEDGSGDEESRD